MRFGVIFAIIGFIGDIYSLYTLCPLYPSPSPRPGASRAINQDTTEHEEVDRSSNLLGKRLNQM